MTKKHIFRSRLAAQYSAAVSISQKLQSSPLALLGHTEIEALKHRPVRQSTFRTLHSSLLFTETKTPLGSGKGVDSLKLVSQVILRGEISHPHVTEETSRLLA